MPRPGKVFIVTYPKCGTTWMHHILCSILTHRLPQFKGRDFITQLFGVTTDVTRNPYDCAVSYYHFLKASTPKKITEISFERYLDVFLSGKFETTSDVFLHKL
ncbi:sulfotransferase 1C3-like [Dermacentor andersoni]|uniref:sulfotransferase 1C3-like n=1 Tax=Dermacentor andersoni TaxID=34620 RepID=UPI003B3AE637